MDIELSGDGGISGGNSGSLPPTTIFNSDGRAEIQGGEALLQASPLYNEDLAPIPLKQRNWSTYNFVALWAAMCACIPTYMLSSGLIASGMSWWQALITILLGNTIVLIPILLNSHPGTKYGIPFPVFARASYGTAGSNLPALMRALVACGWFGIQAWIGGQALYQFGCAINPAWATMLGPANLEGHSGTEWLSFAAFWSLNVLVIYKGMELLKRVQGIAAPFVFVMTAALVCWAVQHAHGVGELMHERGKFHSLSTFLPVFFPSLTAMIGFWATLSLNMPDFTRFGRSQRETTIGQAIALPTAMAIFSAMGVIITSSALVIYPDVPAKELWDPVKLISRFDSPVLVAVSMFTVAVATLSVNIAANVVSPANDFANAFPRWISFKRGGLITGVAGILMQPWKLMADPNGYIFTWLLGYSGGLGSIAGILIVDYWIIRKATLDLPDLYLTQGKYEFQKGWNPAALVATIAGCATAWMGAFFPPSSPGRALYDYGWFVGLFVSGLIYFLMMRNKQA